MRVKDSLTPEFMEKLEAVKQSGKKYGKTKELVIAYIEGNPGADARQIARAIKKPTALTNTNLMGYAKRGIIQRRYLDRRWRYYPDGRGDTPQSDRPKGRRLPEGVKLSFHASRLKELMSEYWWETGDDSMRGFLKWYEDKTNGNDKRSGG